jgi:hypothetical protein
MAKRTLRGNALAFDPTLLKKAQTNGFGIEQDV